jgi:MoxR-like ATPase
MPTEGDGEQLGFTAGQVLRCFKRNEIQRNDLLIIDEINRSDIDKSFGQLFTLLSGQGVELPFTRGGEEIELVPSSETTGAPDSNEYVVPASWRLFATMNSYDKASLYEMSYAFMRRFSFIYVEAPRVPEPEDDRQQLVSSYARTWDIDAEEWVEKAIGAVWYQLNVAVDERPIGPAIVRDMLAHVTHSKKRNRNALTDAVTSYVYPQLEGVRNRGRVISALMRLEHLDGDRLGEVATDVLQVRVDE